jgi:type IV secretion system protein VirB10
MAHDKELKFPAPARGELADKTVRPEGTLPKQAQAYVIAGVTVVILLAVLFSNHSTEAASKTPSASPATAFPSNQRLISEFGESLSEQQRQRQKAELALEIDARQRSLSPSPEASSPAAGEGKTAPDESAAPGAERPPDPLLAHERELEYRSRFASNLVLVAVPGPARAGLASAAPGSPFDSLSEPAAKSGSTSELGPHHPANVSANRALGPAYVVFEGTSVETALVNRLEGDFSGPVKVMVSSPVYSRDRQHVLIPEGTFVLGEAEKVGGLAQRRLAVVFHRLIMPDGYAVDLDQFRGLDQVGQTGLEDQVNRHYGQIFGASIALGVLAGAAESSNSSAALYQSGGEAYRSGVASSLSQSSIQVLDRFLNILPSITIREGHRVRVYFTQDLLLPAYENHAIASDL